GAGGGTCPAEGGGGGSEWRTGAGATTDTRPPGDRGGAPEGGRGGGRGGGTRLSSSRPVGPAKSAGSREPRACRLETGAVSTAPPSADISRPPLPSAVRSAG